MGKRSKKPNIPIDKVVSFIRREKGLGFIESAFRLEREIVSSLKLSNPLKGDKEDDEWISVMYWRNSRGEGVNKKVNDLYNKARPDVEQFLQITVDDPPPVILVGTDSALGESAGQFLNGSLYVTEGWRREVDLTICHEYSHHLFFRVFQESQMYEDNPFIEGFAEGVEARMALLRYTRNKDPGYALVSSERIQNMLGLSREWLTSGKIKLAGHMVGGRYTRVPPDHALGYIFFALLEREYGSDIYRRLLHGPPIRI